MRTSKPTRIIAIIIMTAFISSQCGIGTAFALRAKAAGETTVAQAMGVDLTAGGNANVSTQAGAMGKIQTTLLVATAAILGGSLLLIKQMPSPAPTTHIHSTTPAPKVSAALSAPTAKTWKSPVYISPRPYVSISAPLKRRIGELGSNEEISRYPIEPEYYRSSWGRVMIDGKVLGEVWIGHLDGSIKTYAVRSGIFLFSIHGGNIPPQDAINNWQLEFDIVNSHFGDWGGALEHGTLRIAGQTVLRRGKLVMPHVVINLAKFLRYDKSGEPGWEIPVEIILDSAGQPDGRYNFDITNARLINTAFVMQIQAAQALEQVVIYNNLRENAPLPNRLLPVLPDLSNVAGLLSPDNLDLNSARKRIAQALDSLNPDSLKASLKGANNGVLRPEDESWAYGASVFYSRSLGRASDALKYLPLQTTVTVPVRAVGGADAGAVGQWEIEYDSNNEVLNKVPGLQERINMLALAAVLSIDLQPPITTDDLTEILHQVADAVKTAGELGIISGDFATNEVAALRNATFYAGLPPSYTSGKLTAERRSPEIRDAILKHLGDSSVSAISTGTVGAAGGWIIVDNPESPFPSLRELTQSEIDNMAIAAVIDYVSKSKRNFTADDLNAALKQIVDALESTILNARDFDSQFRNQKIYNIETAIRHHRIDGMARLPRETKGILDYLKNCTIATRATDAGAAGETGKVTSVAKGAGDGEWVTEGMSLSEELVKRDDVIRGSKIAAIAAGKRVLVADELLGKSSSIFRYLQEWGFKPKDITFQSTLLTLEEAEREKAEHDYDFVIIRTVEGKFQLLANDLQVGFTDAPIDSIEDVMKVIEESL